MSRSGKRIIAVLVFLGLVSLSNTAFARGGWPDPLGGWDVAFEGDYADVLAMQADGWYQSNLSGEAGTDNDYTTWGDWDLTDTVFLSLPGQGEIEHGVPTTTALVFQVRDNDTATNGTVRRFRVGKPFAGTYNTQADDLLRREGGVTMVARFRVRNEPPNYPFMEPDSATGERCYRTDALFAFDGAVGVNGTAGLGVGLNSARWCRDDNTVSTNIETGDLTNAFHTFWAVIEPTPGDLNNYAGTLYVDGSVTPAAPKWSGPGDNGPDGTYNGVADDPAYNWYTQSDRFEVAVFPELAGKALAIFGPSRSAAHITIQYDYILWKKGAFRPGAVAPAGRLSRDLPALFTPGTTLTVTLTAFPMGGGQVVTTETIPAGLTPTLLTPYAGTATVVGQNIIWTLTLGATTETLRYTVLPGDERSYTFSGLYYGVGVSVQPVPGDVQTFNSTLKRVIFIRNSGAGDYATHDRNIIRAISDGLTAQGQPIPGLGYAVIEVQGGADLATYTPADGDLIFMSQTPNRADAREHGNDPLPIIHTEQGNFDDHDGNLSDMFFCDNSDSRDTPDAFQITTSHPITRIFPMGNLQICANDSGNQAQIGVMVDGLATSAVLALAVNPTAPTETCLAVAEAGATGFRAGGPAGYDPAPARRVCLGYHQYTMTTPTVQAVYLLQRVFQWAMGENVTAGTPPPAAPGNLAGTVISGRVQLTWQDNSDNENGFRLERKLEAGGTYGTVATLPYNSVSYLDADVTSATYYYRVHAFNLAGSNVSNEAMVAVEFTLGAQGWRLYR